MASMSFGAPQPWPPPPTTATKSFKDNCNPGICTTTCLQYCNYFYLQPPPQQQQQFPLINNNSSVDDDDDSSSSRSISPLMAALIAVLAAAFLLLFYYTVVSRFCRRRQTRRNLRRRLDPSTSHRVDPMIHDPARPDTGLDESYIRQITVFKYKRGDGLVEATECAVCLTEFTEEESLRLMPNCEHAFHINCIDTWLVTHSSCPLCRSTMNHLPERAGGGGVSVAALRVERSNDEVVVVENGGEVRIEVVVEVDNEERLEEREKDIP